MREPTECLKPHKRLSSEIKKKRKYYFSRYIIEKYKDRASDHTGLIAFLEAAKLFDLYPDNFYKKYIKTGRLKPALSEGRRSEHFFRTEDVEALLGIEKQTIITPEAAAILGVNVSCVNKMIASGTLKPISGPKIDGFGKNLFLRQDVEKLDAERRAFKAKCVRQGKTARFGCPKARPIRSAQEKIGPRAEQLLKEWSAEVIKKPISGMRLYRQLVEDGYKVGIVTVYVYLRQRYLSSAQAI